MFRAGQKVCCVDAKNSSQLREGAIYTVKKIETGGLTRWRGMVGTWASVWLYEAETDGCRFYGFCSERFRPINDRETDISVFKSLLNPANHKENVDA